VDPISPRPMVADATARTHRWAERSLQARSRPDQALFGIVQGGIDPQLRAESTRIIAGMPFDGIAVGGLAGSETKEEMAAALDVVDGALGDDPRVRYLMGIGSPPDFFAAVERGIDIFDSVLPTRVARNGQVWTDAGRLNLRNARFLDETDPIDVDCRCETCRTHSRAYLAHLFRAEELLAYRLATVHNLTYTLDLMRRLRASLADGSFASLRDAVAERYAAPTTVSAVSDE
jgi:queuine tRNA-ribosyltransferase